MSAKRKGKKIRGIFGREGLVRYARNLGYSLYYGTYKKDSHGDTKRLKLKTREALSLPQGERVVVEFDCLDPIGEAQGLLAGVCSILATDCTIFPIGFDKWPDMPKSYINDCFNNIIKPHFCFMTIEEDAQGYVYRFISKKWAASRQKLWDEFKDPLKTKDEIMDNVPVGITRDQWTSFVNYHYKEETQNMCKRNAENRKKQTVPHTGGSKPNSRRRAEMMAETGSKPGRAQLISYTYETRWILKEYQIMLFSEFCNSYFHLNTPFSQLMMFDSRHASNRFASDVVIFDILEKVALATSESIVDESEISPNDVVGKVLGKEHPGRVRCLGLGATPSNTFRETNLRPGNIRIVSNVGCSSSGCQEKYNQLMNTLKAYMIMKEGSTPEQFAGIFDSTPTTPNDAASGPISPTDARRSSGASNPSDH
ncbi:PREDICTED: uncharacterized protein LOC109218265 [Nicotiana attenuata]|uniref:uncharacterized protein LOC109218265 n=1 Tax=Nicotiana attenuata TaxID=49451 RepID=UPI000905A0DA|nr:PREDICTED: uncharacterized protein LOC109218265 [Nicotiana attenuata]